MKNYYDFDTDTVHYKGKEIKLFSEFTQQQWMKDYVRDNLIVLYVGGYNAYGIATETSDVDIRGMFRDNIDMVLGYNRIEQLENNTNDIVIYAASKILKLIIDQSPNAQEALWVDEEEILYSTPTYEYLRYIRWEILSKQAKHKYAGYGMSQTNRAKGHKKYLTKEQEGKYKDKPHVKSYIHYISNDNGDVCKVKHLFLGSDHYFTKIKDELYNMWFTRSGKVYPLIEEGNNFIPIQEGHEEGDLYEGVIWFNKSQFQLDQDDYNKYQTWKANRNVDRHKMEQEFGIDLKHMAHCSRLLRTGAEILEGKGVLVKRPDREYLRDIRRGKYTYEELLAEAEKYDKEILPKLYEESKLQHTVDPKVYVDLMKKILSGEI